MACLDALHLYLPLDVEKNIDNPGTHWNFHVHIFSLPKFYIINTIQGFKVYLGNSS